MLRGLDTHAINVDIEVLNIKRFIRALEEGLMTRL